LIFPFSLFFFTPSRRHFFQLFSHLFSRPKNSVMKKRSYRGWITAEELAVEQGVRADAMAVDEDGRPYLAHTTRLFAAAAARDVFHRPKKVAADAAADAVPPPARAPLDDDDEEEYSTKRPRRRRRGASTSRPVAEPFRSAHTEAKLARRAAAATATASSSSVVECAKTCLLLSVVPDKAPCRSDQEESIFVHLVDRIRGDASELLYVSGQPGTGKTLTVHRVLARVLALRDAGSLPPFKFVSINVLNDLPSPPALFQRLHADVTGHQLTANKAQRALEASWYTTDDTRAAPHYVVLLLDELDSLVASSSSSKVLHTLLEWMSRPRSRLLVIGISNTIGLLERLDTKTLSRSGMAVRKVLFRPYTWEDILQIVESRLHSANAAALFDRQALELCAKKTASDKGDVRRALQVCLRAVEKHEAVLPALPVSVLAMAECLRDLRTGSFATALANLSLFEKLFMWAVAREAAVTGSPGPFAFAALEARLSVELEQIRPLALLACPGRHIWERVRDSLLSSRLVLSSGANQQLLGCPAEFQPEDILFYMKKSLRDDDILKHLPRIGNSYD
jgi:origin recognition complex subunit 1